MLIRILSKCVQDIVGTLNICKIQIKHLLLCRNINHSYVDDDNYKINALL